MNLFEFVLLNRFAFQLGLSGSNRGSNLPVAVRTLFRFEDCREPSYTLQESIWDCVCLVGMPEVDCTCGAFILLGALCNAVMELVFCAIVYSSMITPPVDESTLQAIKHWRAVVGHDIQWADTSSKWSLVSQMCSHNPALQFAATQSGFVDDLSDYLHPTTQSAVSDKLNGNTLLVFSLLLYLWELFLDTIHNFEVTRAVIAHTHKEPSWAVKDGCLSAKFGPVQLVMMLLASTLPRLTVEVFLSYVGILFLVATVSMSDLLLNAMALAFILDIDEQVFSIIVPCKIRRMMDRMAPLELRFLHELALPHLHASLHKPLHRIGERREERRGERGKRRGEERREERR